MVRVRQMLRRGIPAAGGAVAGVVLAVVLAVGPAGAGTAAQDPAVQQQIQQALSNFQIQQQVELNMLRSRISTLEQEQQNIRFQRDMRAAGGGGGATAPTPADPIPGVATYGRLVSEASEAQRFTLNAARGDLLAQLAMTSDGPGLILFDASGRISVALLATPTGAELRMVGADGTLQTVLAGQ